MTEFEKMVQHAAARAAYRRATEAADTDREARERANQVSITRATLIALFGEKLVQHMQITSNDLYSLGDLATVAIAYKGINYSVWRNQDGLWIIGRVSVPAITYPKDTAGQEANTDELLSAMLDQHDRKQSYVPAPAITRKRAYIID